MVKNTIDTIVSKRLKWHRIEVILLWLIIATTVILIPTGIGIYLYVDRLSIAEYVFSVPPGNLAIFQVRMLSIFSRSLGAVFALTGAAIITLARNRLSVGKDAYRMAAIMRDSTKEKQVRQN